MQQLEIKDAEIMTLAIQDEISRSAEARYDHRLHGVLMVCKGLSCYEVADILGHSPRAIEYWVKRFEAKGFVGLQEKPRSGRPPRIGMEIMEQLGKDLRQTPRVFGYTQNFWDGILLSHHLASVYDVKLGARQCQRLFHKLDFRLRKPRGVIAKADPSAQEAFKKTGRKRSP